MPTDHHIGIRIGQHMVRADIGCVIKPIPRHLCQNLALKGD